MDSCPVCYSSFSVEEEETVARKLPCDHVACTQCLQDCFEDAGERRDPSEPEGSGIRCPECFNLFLFDSVQSVPLYEVPVEARAEEVCYDADGVAAEATAGLEEGGGAGLGLRNGEGQLRHGEDAAATAPAPAPAPAAAKTSKLASFLSANKGESHIPTFEVVQGQGEEGDADGGMGGKEGGRLCNVQGCDNRAVGNVTVCAMHTKRLSVVSVSAMVHKFKDTKLSSVALKSDKVEVNRGGVAGAGEAGFDPDAIGERFRRQERLELGEAVALIEAVKNIFREENNMVELDAPVMVVGDVHGQYFDLLNILKRWRPDHNLLFLGDYVDRGQFSCEVILHLFALKLRHPNKVFMIRGNHECSSVSAHFGFKDECKMKYGLTVYYRFLLAFQTMPICALVATTTGRIFACHGGISPDIKRLSDIEEIDRFAEPEMEGPLCDMLWADPLNEDDSHKLTDDEYQHFLDTDYVTNQVRGCSYMFGYHAVQRFLRENRLMYMLRAHEVQEEGFRSHFPSHRSPELALAAAAAAAEEGDFSDEDSDLGSEEEEEADSYDQVLADTSRHLNPTVLTVFSAPNYCDRYGNKAAVLHVEKTGYYIVNLLEAEPHPAPVKESDVNVMQALAMGNTCPYMPTTFREFLNVAVELGRAVKPTSTNNSTVTEDLAAAARAAGALQSTPTHSWSEDHDKEDTNTNTNTNTKGGDSGDKSDGDGNAAEGNGNADATAAAAGATDKAPVDGPPRQPPPAPTRTPMVRGTSLPAGTSSSGAGGGKDVSAAPSNLRPRQTPRPPPPGEEGEDELGVILPSFAPRVRAGPSRMTSAPVLSGSGSRSSSIGSGGGGRRRRSSRGSSVGSQGSSFEGSFDLLVDGGKNDRNPNGGSSDADADAYADIDSDGESSTSFFGVMSSFSRRSMRGLGLIDARASGSGAGRGRGLSRQNTWSVGTPKAPTSEAYRQAHARDGINEMHPDILNRRISSQESGELDASRESILSMPSTASITPKTDDGGLASPSFSGLEGLLFGPDGMNNKKKSSTAPTPLFRQGEGGDDDDASTAPPSRGVRRQFSLDLAAGSPSPRNRLKENKSTRELAALMSNASITELAGMDGDVEVDIDPADAENDALAVERERERERENGSLLGGSLSSLSGRQLSTSPFNSNWSSSQPRSRDTSFDAEVRSRNWSSSQPRSRDTSFDAEGMMTPSPRSRKGSIAGESASPSQILFTHEEIVVLKLLFSLFDRGGKNFITRDDIIAYAEEGGDFAQLKEVDSFMEAIDADTDGKVGLSDYINFAARLKGIHLLQQQYDHDHEHDHDNASLPPPSEGEEETGDVDHHQDPTPASTPASADADADLECEYPSYVE